MTCNTPGTLTLFYYIKVARDIIFIAAPILLIVLGTIDFLKAVTANDEKGMKKAIDDFIKRLLICAVIIILPLLISLIMSVTNFGSKEDCFKKATKSNIEALEKKEAEEKKKQEEEERKKKEEETQKQQEQPQPTNPSTNTSKLVSVDLTDLGCPVYYAETKLSKLVFSSSVANDVHEIFKDVCGYINSTSFLYRIETAGAYVNKEGYHGRGLAVDLFNNWKYTKNGTTYTPYAGQGNATWNRYNKFICEVCNGKENCPYNITYQIYTGYFKSKGWCWGGSWSTAYFDPMHFEKTDGGCKAIPTDRIKC